MDQKSITEAVKQICQEKGISFESVIETINAALAAAYRKDFGEKNQNIKVDFDIETGKIKVFDVKTVVDDVPKEDLESLELGKEEKEKRAPEEKTEGEEEKKYLNPKTEVQISEILQTKKDTKIGDEIITPLELPGDFGRMAAQTAKQVITQKLRETEREVMFKEFKEKEGEILVGTVQRREGRMVLIDLGRLTALLPPEEQIEDENYSPGGHIKVYVISVTATTKGPEVIVSRSHPEIVKKLFAMEIPEIASGVVEIKGISREAGSRSKVAVCTNQENIDPIGSCIGQRGARIQTIISELKGEKVDIIKYSDNPAEFIANALSPAKVIDTRLNEGEKSATAIVDENQLSLAIGKAGQNVRLAAKLTGWKIDIISAEGQKVEAEVPQEPAPAAEAGKTKPEVLKNSDNKEVNKDKEEDKKKPKKKEKDNEDKEDAEKKGSKKLKKKPKPKSKID